MEIIYQEIIHLYDSEGVHIFYPRKNSNICNDPFQLVELNQQLINNGALLKSSAKPRKSSHILHVVTNNEIPKENVQPCSKKSKLLVETFKNTTQQLSAKVSQQVVTQS
ncbi:gephyrin: PROVISIONAL [Gigaspora margarita]|uniref:Gephyrin: PROVISIONAL n=1 Tax=Gigaspora margarita TaxID=4874 RepID=A0A8H3XGK4_GIGMA|nr:gephyrin: PROVISIONAL [Gigaspora margarita]